MKTLNSAPVVCVIQARVGSTRLPGKVLQKVADKTLIEHVIDRVKQSKQIEKIILATSVEKGNEALKKIADKNKILFFAGSENNVLDRFYQALKANGFSGDATVVRITGDCPLIDPEVIDRVISTFQSNGCDYVSNVNPPTYPDGLDTEVFSFEALERAWKEARQPRDLEHVTLYIRESDKFRKENVCYEEDLSDKRWTVDEKEDLVLVKDIFEKLSKKTRFRMKDILEYQKKSPKTFEVNRSHKRNEALSQDAKFSKSQKLLKKARTLTPLGAQTFSRSYRYFCEGVSPSFIEKGNGAQVWDVDGNEFTDFILSLGAVTVGYNNAEINSAINDQLKKGIIFSQPSPLSITLAEKLTEIIPSAEMVRFVKNGSDATSAAVRLARAFTGNELIIASGYHGWQDWYIASTPNTRGIPKGVVKYTRSCPYNDLNALKKILKENSGKVAAMIMEPVQGDGPNPGYLNAVKELLHESEALLIFDEVVSGFRVALGGAQAHYGVTPDLSSFGKGMANGMPLSCVVGKKEILNLIEQGVFISTTFGDELLSMAASMKTIEILGRSGSIETMWRYGNLYKKEVEKIIQKKTLQKFVSIKGLAPHCGTEFQNAPGLSYLDLQSVFQQKLIERGILSIGINNFCLSHNEKDIQRFIAASEEALDDVKKAVQAESTKGILKSGGINPIFRRN